MANPLFDALIGGKPADRPFLTLPEGGTLTYGDIDRLSARLANLLVAEGVAPGDRVAVQVEKSPQAFALYLACLRAGAAFLPLNTAYTAKEIAYFIGDAEPAMVVVDPARAAQSDAFLADAKTPPKVLTLAGDGTGSLIDGAAGQPDAQTPVARAADDLAAILYTSGTTGRSKGAMLTQANLLSNAQVLAEVWRFSDTDILLHALPIYHTHGLFVAANVVMLTGGQMIWLAKFDADQVMHWLPKTTTMMGVPTYYTRLLDRAEFDAGMVRGMRLFTSGSAPLLAETHRQFEDRTGHRILERYGMTETGMNTSNPYEGERRAGTVGPALPGVEVRITDGDKILPPLEVGMIEVRGPNVFKGYWRMPGKTAEELSEDGWFTTGDLGVIDADGYVSIVGRSKDLIISGGINIYPKEVELVIDALPDVRESAVIGVPHPDFGEGVIAIVVAEPGSHPQPEAILAALSGQLARFKQPKAVFLADELPRNTMGKVQKAVLRNRYADLFRR